MNVDYFPVPHAGGFILGMQVDKAKYYSDRDGCWLRSKTNMRPIMDIGQVESRIKQFEKEDYEVYRKWRIR